MLARMVAQQCRLVIRGEIRSRYASAFEGMKIRPHDGVTEMTGTIADASELHAVLERLAALGLTLISLNMPDEESSRTPGGEPPGEEFQPHE